MGRKAQYDRDGLIEQARDIFWRRGWAGTSMKDLEQELQLKPGSFYAAFGSKEGLFELALARYATEGLARLQALAAEHGPLEALQRHPHLVVGNRNAASKACMLSKTLLELQAQDHPLAEKAGAHLRSMEEAFTSLFAQAQDLGQISRVRDPSVLARRYQSDLLGLRVSAERADVDAVQTADEIAEGLMRL